MAYKSKINKYTGQLQLVLDGTLIKFKEKVANAAALPTEGNTDGDARITTDTGNLYIWNESEGAWEDQGDIIDLDWEAINNRPTSTTSQIDTAVTKSHDQNTDTILDEGGANELTAEEINSSLHTQNTDTKLDEGGANEVSAEYLEKFMPSSEYNNREFIADGSTLFGVKFNNNTTDEGIYGINPSLVHLITYDATDKKFGTHSAMFPNNVWARINYPNSPVWDMFADNTATYVLDVFGKLEEENITDSDYRTIIGQTQNAGNRWNFLVYNNQIRLNAYSGGSTVLGLSSGVGVSDTDWHRYTIVKIGSVFGLYLDNKQIGYEEFSQEFTLSGELVLGSMAYSNTSNDFWGPWYGNLDNLMISNRNCVYASPNSDLSDTLFSQLPIELEKKFHTQNTDTKLDEGGANEVSAENLVKSGIQFGMDGGGSEITAGIQGTIEIPFDCTIQEARLLAPNESGDLTVDIWKTTYTNLEAVDSSDSITGTETPEISSGQKFENTDLTSWDTSLSEGDLLVFNVSGSPTITNATIVLKIKKV